MLSSFVLLLCGLSTVLGGLVPDGFKPIFDGRIVGGEIASIEELPYQAALLQFNIHRCGASIISPTTAITAAHCLQQVFAKRLTLIAGTVIRAKSKIVKKVTKFATHPLYDDDVIDHDVAILWLESPLEFNERIQPIALPDFKEPIPSGAIGIVSGWGKLREGGISSSEVLRYVALPVVDQEKCITLLSGQIVSEFMVCAGVEEGGKDACQQDSGGPFAVNNKLVGVVSWALGCGRPNLPGVYARVASMRDWIDEALAKEESHLI